MSEPDVVAELAWWLRLMAEDPEDRASPITAHDMLKRAHDEIVALRDTVERQKLVLSKGHAETRDEALEVAAAIAQRTKTVEGRETAIAIRKLKEGPKCP